MAGGPVRASDGARDGSGASSDTARFTAAVDFVALNVTVTDEWHRFVTDLGADDLAVYEDGVRQPLEFFTHESLPVDLSILIDASSSMESRFAAVKRAARGFVETLRPCDRAQVATFNSVVRVVQPFTSDPAALEQAIDSIRAGGLTALYTALYVSLKEQTADLRMRMTSGDLELRRRAIVVLSDGEDNGNALGPKEVLDLASRSDVAVYTISLDRRLKKSDEDESREPTMDGFRAHDVWMREFAVRSGGLAFAPVLVADLAKIYGEIAAELANQYCVAYRPRSPQGGVWHAIHVKVLRGGATSRTRAGYFAGSSKGGLRR